MKKHSDSWSMFVFFGIILFVIGVTFNLLMPFIYSAASFVIAVVEHKERR